MFDQLYQKMYNDTICVYKYVYKYVHNIWYVCW